MQIAYEQIDNEFWYGKYRPFKVIIHFQSGYIMSASYVSNAAKNLGTGKKINPVKN